MQTADIVFTRRPYKPAVCWRVSPVIHLFWYGDSRRNT